MSISFAQVQDRIASVFCATLQYPTGQGQEEIFDTKVFRGGIIAKAMQRTAESITNGIILFARGDARHILGQLTKRNFELKASNIVT
jgi:hypothetical protein